MIKCLKQILYISLFIQTNNFKATKIDIYLYIIALCKKAERRELRHKYIFK